MPDRLSVSARTRAVYSETAAPGGIAGRLRSTSTHPFVFANGAPLPPYGIQIQPVFSDGTGQQASRYTNIRNRGFRYVRMTLMWSRIETSSGVYDTAQMTQLDTQIGYAKAAGLYVVLDGIHCFGPSGGGITGTTGGGFTYIPTWAQAVGGDTVNVISQTGAPFLKMLASRYVNEPAVMCLDMVNEPYRYNTGNANPYDQDGVLAMYETLRAEVRSVHSTLILAVGGTFGDTSAKNTNIDGILTDKTNVIWTMHYYYAGGDTTSTLRDGYADAHPGRLGVSVSDGVQGFDTTYGNQLEPHLLVNLTKCQQVGLPLWIGEFSIGESAPGRDQWVSAVVGLFRLHDLSMSWWEYRTANPNSATNTDHTWRGQIPIVFSTPAKAVT